MTRTVTHLVVTDLFAGVERYVTTVAAATHARGWRVRVLGGQEEQMTRRLPPGVEWHPAPTLRGAVRALTLGDDAAGDVWHLHMTAADIAAALPPRDRVRVATRHFAAARGSTPPARLAGRLAAMRLDVEIAISRTVRDATGDPSMPVLLNPVPDHDAVRRPGRTVVVAQRLEPEKETVEAVEVFAASGLAGRGWTLEVHGRGTEASRVEAAIVRHGLDDVAQLVGWTDDMPGLLARAGVLLASAPHEPLGLTVGEAMAAGVPVVATGAGGHLETVGAVPGAALYQPGDVAAGGAVLRALATRDDREEYGAALRRWQREHLSVDGHVDALLDLYAGRV